MKIDELDTRELEEALEMFEGVPTPQKESAPKKRVTGKKFMKLLEEELDEILLCFKHYVQEEGDIACLAEAEERTENLLQLVQGSKITIGFKGDSSNV